MGVFRLLATCLLLSLGACGQDGPDAAPAEPDSVAADAAATGNGDRQRAIKAATDSINGTRIANADSEPGNWLAHGRTYDEQRHSPLEQINTASVTDLGLAWYWDTGTTRGLEATPIVVDGIMFSTGPWSVVWAHDARTGELIWKYDPQVPKPYGKFACCDVVNRGVAAWQGRVYVGTIDGRLIALDAASGKPGFWKRLVGH